MNVQEGEARGRRTWCVLAAGEGESWTQRSFGGGQRSWKEQEALHEISCPAEVVGGARCTSSLGVRALVGDLGAGGVGVATDAAEGLRRSRIWGRRSSGRLGLGENGADGLGENPQPDLGGGGSG